MKVNSDGKSPPSLHLLSLYNESLDFINWIFKRLSYQTKILKMSKSEVTFLLNFYS